MAALHAPGTGAEPAGGRHGRQVAIVAAIALVLAVVVASFGLRGLTGDDAQASPATQPTPSPPWTPTRQDPGVRAGVGPRGDLPALPPAARSPSAGTRVRLGDITDGVLRRAPDRTWQVRVRWNGRLQPVATRGPVGLGGPSTAYVSASWVSADGLLYTRVPTARPDRFRVYAWEPRGGTAYTPPTLVATDLGSVCFTPTFTAFGDCRTDG
jgi:hypothetical protein